MVAETKKEEKALTPEELEIEKKEEEELLATPEEATVRSQIIEKLGLDEDSDSELISKLVADKLADRKKFGKLVGQKRGWREKAQKKKEDKPQPKEKKPEEKKFITQDDLDARDRKRDLESLKVSDSLQTEVENYAKLHGCSVTKAFESDYIKFRKAEEDKQTKIEEASLGETHDKPRTSSQIKGLSDPELLKAIKDVDKSTEKGRKKFEALKDELKSRG